MENIAFPLTQSSCCNRLGKRVIKKQNQTALQHKHATLPSHTSLCLKNFIFSLNAGEEYTAIGAKADQQREWYQSKGTYCTSARTHTHARSSAIPKHRAFGSVRDLPRRRVSGLCLSSYFAAPKIKQWRVGERSTQHPPTTLVLFVLSGRHGRANSYLYMYTKWRGACVCTTPCQMKNNEGKGKKKSPHRGGHNFLRWTSPVSKEAADPNPRARHR